MKKTITLITALMLAVTLAGCQATPEKPVVIEKDDEKMLEKAQQEITVPFSAPTHYTPEKPIVNATGDLEVYIDAEVSVPDTDNLTTARVERHMFTEDECKEYVSALFGKEKTYSGEVLNTKQSYQDTILEWELQLATETDEQKKTQLQESIDKFRMAMDDLPEGEGLVETPVKFRTTQSGMETIYLVSDGTDGIYRTFSVDMHEELNSYLLTYSAGKNGYNAIQNLWSTTTASGIKHGTDEYGAPDTLAELRLTETQAINIADEMVSRMGIDNYAHKQTDVVYGRIDETLQRAYQLDYTRKLGENQFSLVDTRADGAMDDGKGGYIYGWAYERLTFIITDNGIARIELENPYDVRDVITDNTSILSFEDIMEIFEKMFVISHSHIQEGVSEKYHINRIELGLMRITDSTTRRAGLIVPVWNFYGTRTTTDASSESIQNNPNTSYLTINAIDGSVIDLTKGY